MKAIIFSLAFIGLLSNVSPAQTEAAPAAATTLAAVPAKLQELNYLTDARPAADASFYVYLSSASWCGPCRAIMPKVVEQYPAIKAAGGEIILLCFDDTPRPGADYVKKYNACCYVHLPFCCQAWPAWLYCPQRHPQCHFRNPRWKNAQQWPWCHRAELAGYHLQVKSPSYIAYRKAAVFYAAAFSLLLDRKGT